MQFMSNTFHLYKNEGNAIGMQLQNEMRYSKIAYNQFYIHGPNLSGIAIHGATNVDGGEFLGVSDLGIFNNTFYKSTDSPSDWTACSNGVNFSNGIWMSTNGYANLRAPHRIEIGNNSVQAGLNNVIAYYTDSTDLIKVGNMYNNTGSNFVGQTGAGWDYTDCPVQKPATTAKAKGDFDLDGYTDILFQAQDTSMKVWHMGICDWRLPHFERETVVTPTPTPTNIWRICGTGRVDTNNTTDLFFQSDNGYVVWWTMNGTTNQSGNYVYQDGNPVNMGPGWRVVGCGDLDNDGVADLLFYHTNHYIGYWLLTWTNNWVYVKQTGLLNPNYAAPDWRPVAVGISTAMGMPIFSFKGRPGALVTGSYVSGI
jgi:hypothetical protein